jgi:hypothetical protein
VCAITRDLESQHVAIVLGDLHNVGHVICGTAALKRIVVTAPAVMMSPEALQDDRIQRG